MDAPGCDRASLKEALRLIALGNRWSGCDRLLFREVGRFAAMGRMAAFGSPERLRLLDVGAGAGHAGLRLAHRLAGRGWSPHLVLADLNPTVLAIARNRVGRQPFSSRDRVRVDLVRLTGPKLPFSDQSFDVAFSSTTLHHMERAEAIAFLRELDRVSRLGWIVADLRRSRTAYAAIGLVATLLPRHSLPRHDGPTSVRRAFTPRELEALGAAAGLTDAVVSGSLLRIVIRGPGGGRMPETESWADGAGPTGESP